MTLDQGIDETMIFVAERDGVGAADARVGDLNKNLIGANNRYGHFTDSVSLWLTSITN
jgi:hypothetical protein